MSTLRLAGGISGSRSELLTDPNIASIATLSQSMALGTGTLAQLEAGPLTSKTLPLSGNTKFCLLLVGCSAWLDIPLTEHGTRGLGIGGFVTENAFGAGVRISIGGAPWTIGTAILTGAFTSNAMVPHAQRATETVEGKMTARVDELIEQIKAKMTPEQIAEGDRRVEEMRKAEADGTAPAATDPGPLEEPGARRVAGRAM